MASGSAAALALLGRGCGESKEEPAAADAGPAPVSMPSRVEGYRGLATLPWFEIRDGRLVCVVDDLPPVVDFHAHLGFTVGRNTVDLTRATDEVRYLIDCDGVDPPCTLDFEEYVNRIATEEMLRIMTREIGAGVITGKGYIETHTAPNLVREMDAMKVDRAVLLPIAVGLVEPDDMTERWREAVAATGTGERFVQFCGVHPDAEDALERLRAYHAAGYRGLKFHPTQQNVAPDTDASMRLFEEAGRLGMCVFFHAGRAGIEPRGAENAVMARYIAPIETFPDIPFVFGHAGARDFDEALPIMKAHENVWVGTHGQGLPNLRRLIAEADTHRLLFGSDWPFYPIAATLAKALAVTQTDPALRERLLGKNARTLLGLG